MTGNIDLIEKRDVEFAKNVDMLPMLTTVLAHIPPSDPPPPPPPVQDQSRAVPPWVSGPGSGSGSGSALGSRGSTGSRGSQRHPTAECEQLDGGIVRVGKISFDGEACIGKGCEGTFVYK